MSSSRTPGISVVVATNLGEGHIGRCLESLASQTLEPDRYEVIVVIIGGGGGTRAVVEAVRERSPHLVLRVIEVERDGVSRARNLGLAAASMPYVTFVDDDDYVSPSYVRALSGYAQDRVVPVTQIMDVVGSSLPDADNPINEQIRGFAGQRVDVVKMLRAMELIAAKAFPTQVARQALYDTRLSSGEDVDFLMRVFAQHDFELFACPVAEDAVYFRTIGPGPPTRDAMDFKSAITDRLAVIKKLDAVGSSSFDWRCREAVRQLTRGQVTHMNRYVRMNVMEHDVVLHAIRSQQLAHFPYDALNALLATTLIASYCFVPTLDTSAIVAAKRVQTRGEVVNVISNQMDGVRDTDPTSGRIAEEFVERNTVISTRAKFNDWSSIAEFASAGLAAAERGMNARAPYQRLRSRAMWPHSQVLAALLKVRHPDLFWSAEFSDPLSHDVRGQLRRGRLPHRDPFVDELRAAATGVGFELPASESFFELIELVTYTLADEIVFTNEDQREYMLDYCPVVGLADRARAISMISPHPTLPGRFYELASSGVPLSPSSVNLGYFGALYENRGLDELLHGIESLDAHRRALIRVWVFTANVAKAEQEVERRHVAAWVSVQPMIPYLEFLDLCRRLDCLFVNDAVTKDTHGRNPYLPSKWSDYRGSGTPVWGMVEKGSPLSRVALDYVSELGDPGATTDALERIVSDLSPTGRAAPLLSTLDDD